jgi:hypothetical protein
MKTRVKSVGLLKLSRDITQEKKKKKTQTIWKQFAETTALEMTSEKSVRCRNLKKKYSHHSSQMRRLEYYFGSLPLKVILWSDDYHDQLLQSIGLMQTCIGF